MRRGWVDIHIQGSVVSVLGFRDMPAGFMVPARNMPSMIGMGGNNIGGFASSSSGLSLGQVWNISSNLLDNLNLYVFQDL